MGWYTNASIVYFVKHVTTNTCILCIYHPENWNLHVGPICGLPLPDSLRPGSDWMWDGRQCTTGCEGDPSICGDISLSPHQTPSLCGLHEWKPPWFYNKTKINTYFYSLYLSLSSWISNDTYLWNILICDINMWIKSKFINKQNINTKLSLPDYCFC